MMVTTKAHHFGIQLEINEKKWQKVEKLSRMYFIIPLVVAHDKVNRGEWW